FFGGTRQGMAISWPAKITDKGGIRWQFHHLIDIVPTLLEVTGIPAPVMVDGVAQKPIEGVSMAYTFDKANANAPSRHRTQYFEIMGVHGLYNDGWMLSAVPLRAPWQLATAAVRGRAAPLAFCIWPPEKTTGRRTMRAIGLVLLSIAITALLLTDADAKRRSSARGSQAAGASRSWCATYPGKGISDNCGYSSFNQCYQTVLGLGGFC